MEQKMYMDINRLKEKFTNGFETGDLIVIQEKIDGANFGIRYDSETNTVAAFSRKTKLDHKNNLRGAYELSQKLDVNLVKDILGDRYELFGEYLCSHTVKYPDDKYNKVYAFDVYDLVDDKWLNQEESMKIAEALGIEYVPVFYVGEFTSWEDVISYVGKTKMGGEYGEGVVVKNISKLNNKDIKYPFYVKIVCEQFCETKGHRGSKPVDENKLKEKERIQEIVKSVVTEARVRKILHKFTDEGIIPVDWDEKDMSTIAKNMGKEIYYDCVKEEPETVELVENFGKYSNGVAMCIVRDILKKER